MNIAPFVYKYALRLSEVSVLKALIHSLKLQSTHEGRSLSEIHSALKLTLYNYDMKLSTITSVLKRLEKKGVVTVMRQKFKCSIYNLTDIEDLKRATS